MKYLIIFSIIITSFLFNSLSAQGFTSPAEGKAVVYFVRVSNFGLAVNFEFFDNEKYIGAFKGKNYMRYECNPGKQLFWASSENKEFITAELQEGKSYIVIVDVIMGAWKARVGLTPLVNHESELYHRAKELIIKQAPIVTPSSKIEKMNVKLESFIKEKLKMYEEVWSKDQKIEHLPLEAYIKQ